MLVSTLYLAFSTWLSLIFLMKGVAKRWIVILFLALSGLIYSRDTFLLFIPFCAGLAVCKALSSKECDYLIQSKYAPIYIALLFLPFGLLLLTKGTMLVTCGAICFCSAIALFFNQYKKLAFICLISPVISIVFFWITSGQLLENLPIYIGSMQAIISGYTNAMSVIGQPFEIIRYLLSAILILASIYFQKNLKKKVFLLGLYCIFLFISFKGGFVRHDSHAVLSATSLLIATVLLPLVGIQSKLFIATLIVSLSSVAYINGNYLRTTPESFIQNVSGMYTGAANGILKRLNYKEQLGQEYWEALSAIHSTVSFPALLGTADIYSYGQAHLLASANTWSPRPVFQSYAAYTPRLDDLNRQHLEGVASPNNIFISIEPIDQRLPSSEDGSSWPLLLSQYKPVKVINHYLLLEKIRPIKTVNLQWGNPEIYRLTERVLLPKSIDSLRDPVYAKLIIKPTLMGRIKNVLYKQN